MSEKKYTAVKCRVDEDLKNRILAQSELDGITPSIFMREALKDRLYKDVSWQGQVQGALEAMRTEVTKTRRDIKLFSDFFAFWVEYYFIYTKSFGDIGEEQKIVLIHEGKERATAMLNAFKRKLKNEKPGLTEMLLADYMTEEDVASNE